MSQTDSLAIFRFRFQLHLTESLVPANERNPLREQTVGEMLEEATHCAPEAIALVDGVANQDPRRRWTYAELLDESRRVATLLLRDFAPGQRVAMWEAGLPECEIVRFACAFAGLTLIALEPTRGREEASRSLSLARPAGIIAATATEVPTHASELDTVGHGLPSLRVIRNVGDLHRDSLGVEPSLSAFPVVRPSDPALIAFGSAGAHGAGPAVLSHRGLVNNAYLTAERLDVPQGSVWLSPTPTRDLPCRGLVSLGAVSRRGTHVTVGPDPRQILQLIETEGVSVLTATAPLLGAIRGHPQFGTFELGSMRTIVLHGEPLSASTMHAVESSFDARVISVFGLSESSGVVCAGKPDDGVEERRGTAGQPLPHIDVRIADLNTGRTCPCGQVGEIMVRGFGNMTEYFGLPKETAAAIDADGWLRSGVLATMDQRGFVRVSGRVDSTERDHHGEHHGEHRTEPGTLGNPEG